MSFDNSFKYLLSRRKFIFNNLTNFSKRFKAGWLDCLFSKFLRYHVLVALKTFQLQKRVLGCMQMKQRSKFKMTANLFLEMIHELMVFKLLEQRVSSKLLFKFGYLISANVKFGKDLLILISDSINLGHKKRQKQSGGVM